MILGKRSAATTHAFAARLVAIAEPAEEQEVQKYYVGPQNTSERCGCSAFSSCSLCGLSAEEQEAQIEWVDPSEIVSESKRSVVMTGS